jgi:sodium/bile acid cotransporter 7
MRGLGRFLPDRFALSIVGVVMLGAFLPVQGNAAVWVGIASQVAMALLFFLQGVRLSRQAVLAGILHWRLHLTIFAATFVVFPLLGLALAPLSGPVLAPPIYLGLLFLCCLPSAVQSSVIFTSIAGGNVAAALCSASLSSILGMVLTPLLVGVLLHTQGEAPQGGVVKLIGLLLLPFVAGQALQHWLVPLIKQHQAWSRRLDLGSALLVVYAAISAATLSGMWSRLPLESFAVLVAVDAALMAVMLAANTVAARRLGFAREDRIAIVLCGSQKGLVTGIAMANALFAPATVGFVVLPLMIFHQMQFMVCAALAQRFAKATPWPAVRSGTPSTN